ncbi:hypothetical protein GGX14DRAFT_439572 [Mycena pura]|uniref:Proteophosphoglycan ppg4 n=1 Tax=Mycena pura TaxID=153505 RepID=A0AAD6YG51_9AGAR|nr:hypothetical protein GGX14DRAFT_439572 [Mycena pura]
MAAALLPPRTDAGPRIAPASFHRALLADHDLADSRYPSPRTASMPDSSKTYAPRHAATVPPDVQSLRSNQSQEPFRNVVSYTLTPEAPTRIMERNSLEDTTQRAASRASGETRRTALESTQNPAEAPVQPSPSPELPASLPPSTPRHPALPALGVGTDSSKSKKPNLAPPIMPMSASPGYNPPVSPNPRAYAQQPTYVTPSAPKPVVLSSPPEEVCVECAMRDQDMIDVDVTSPGVWDRESDVMFEELLRREIEDEASDVPFDESRPRARGGLLTEQNLRVWLSVNPREPAARQQTLNTYIKAQRTLLEAEALARARAMQEAKQLDNRMRDTYSQLRRSAYDAGNGAVPVVDDSGGVRIKPPQSPSSPSHPRSHSREVTLLENGMIVEHVDVRKEEKVARERRRKDEKRARKSSRSSVIDVNSIISAQSLNPNADSGVGLNPYSRYSQASSVRPTSVLTAPLDRSELPRAYSQASFSDIHSLGSGSPRLTRFFGMKNLSAGWRSQDSLAPSGMSGSMMDMHVALQNESYRPRVRSPSDLNTARRSQLWPPTDQDVHGSEQIVRDKTTKKKKKGFAKIWGIVTGSSKQQNTDLEPYQSERNEDDSPLAPPPSLSYLVNRRAGESGRQASTPSLPSITSPKFGLSSPGMSPPTAPSSILPSPASSRGPDVDVAERNSTGMTLDEDQHPSDDTIGKSQTVGTRNVHPVTSEPDMRRASQSSSPPSVPLPKTKPTPPQPRPDSMVSFRDKSLPPLPMEAFTHSPEVRPRTVMSFNPPPPPGSGPAHDFVPPQAPFRTVEARRQSFGGLASRPAIALQTAPVMQPVAFGQRRPFGAQYDEYGLSRRSLGPLDNLQEHTAARNPPGSATKRRSRFGLATLFGKKPTLNTSEAMHETAHTFPTMRGSGSDGPHEMGNGYATSTSRHSAFSMGGPRMSVTSRKALEELVSQDAEFVAYRYPSNDHRFDILR